MPRFVLRLLPDRATDFPCIPLEDFRNMTEQPVVGELSRPAVLVRCASGAHGLQLNPIKLDAVVKHRCSEEALGV